MHINNWHVLGGLPENKLEESDRSLGLICFGMTSYCNWINACWHETRYLGSYEITHEKYIPRSLMDKFGVASNIMGWSGLVGPMVIGRSLTHWLPTHWACLHVVLSWFLILSVNAFTWNMWNLVTHIPVDMILTVSRFQGYLYVVVQPSHLDKMLEVRVKPQIIQICTYICVIG